MSAPAVVDFPPIAGASVDESTLPCAWKAALRFCPHCSGCGSVDGRACAPCEGTGDLFGALLRDAYERGRAEVLVKLGQIGECVRVAQEQARDGKLDGTALRRAAGQ